ncbi:CubicO group peptidase (beta-lactamase class C family) [Methylopila capsulata]|uniref:CubicO group peptidase (Beta-lactamase class C family) n=1 Tax=Methylopila capsulata TaxID=61654 RepID=A0A9W6IY10_9HYPH|nr:serine hydrolase domain-containing protein [Methylopila capsulata]MBM7853137.1 CubicO group peptidase (beta-lactamase class C family) [Methylopila capsulata]GLK57649.1 esterase [Methylopila capsulata]
MTTRSPSAARALGDALGAAIDAALADRRIVGAVVLVARDGKLVYRRAAGLADREAGLPMREDVIFRLASVTKPLVTAAAMRLADDGALALDAPVTRWLPDFRPRLADGSAPEITIRHLLTHTSGLSYRFIEPAESPYHLRDVSDGLDQPGLSMAENLTRLAAVPLAFAPGTAWRYSLAIDVLGAAMERAAGASLPDLVAALVTDPLGLRDTRFGVADMDRLATPYVNATPAPIAMADGVAVALDAGAAIFAPSRIIDPASYPSGGAGMSGTAGDVLAFLEAIRTGGAPILGPATIAKMTRDHVGPQAETQGPGWGFGYGWAVLDDPEAAQTPQARGTLQWGGAYGHSWFVDRANALTVVALTNTAFEGMNGRFVADVRDAAYA